MTTISLDFETRSTVDLKRAGLYVYANHPSTSVTTLAWALGDDEPRLWNPRTIGLPAAWFGEHDMRAFNAQFERVIWHAIMVKRYGAPAIPLERWYCTAADAAAMALPRNLEDCARVLRVGEQKGDWSAVSRLSRPRQLVEGKPIWWEREQHPERYKALDEYCLQDVRTERAIAKATRRLGASERAVYLLDQRMNERGMYVDKPLAFAIRAISDVGLEKANETLRDATNGAVTEVTKVADLTQWLASEGVTRKVDPTAEAGVELTGRDVVPVDSVAKDVIRELLEGDHPDHVRRAIEARAEAGRSSLAKIESLLKMTGTDGYARGMLLYYGANTGRWAGRGFQPQNLTRPLVKDQEGYLDMVMARDYAMLDAFASPMLVAVSLLRGMLRASPGHVLRVGDFAQIEARVLNWLAGQADVVELFRSGGKIYEAMAAHIFQVPAATISKTDPRRQIGKNTELGCGYGLGWETFQEQVYIQEGIKMPDQLAQDAVNAYRATHPAVKNLWKGLDNAAKDAVEHPGKICASHRCKFVVRGSYLWLILPSGRPLAYAAPALRLRSVPWDKTGETKRLAVTAEGVDSLTKRWRRRGYYGGLWAENVVQALARDLLAEAMLRQEAAGHRVCLTVHDESVADDPIGFSTQEEFLNLMTIVPAWAAGCPIAVEGYESVRYRK